MTAADPRQRVVLDTNTVIGAGSRWLASESPAPVTPLQRLVHCVASRHVGLYCEEILIEYVELMGRRRHPEERIALFTAYILALFTPVTLSSTECHTVPDDPDDVVFVLCGLDGDADMLISDDRHLLRIREAYHPRPAIMSSSDAGECLFARVPDAEVTRDGAA
jgi:predicted nucleic acid-binding protein